MAQSKSKGIKIIKGGRRSSDKGCVYSHCLSGSGPAQATAKSTFKNFSGVESLEVRPRIEWTRYDHSISGRLSSNRSIAEIAMAFNIVSKHIKLKEMTVAREHHILTKAEHGSLLPQATAKAVIETSYVAVNFVASA